MKYSSDGASMNLAAAPYSGAFFKNVHFWTPPVSTIKPRKKKPNSSLRMAGIVSKRLYEGLKYEGKLFLLTPNNWGEILQYGKLDLLIVESCWETATGDWYLSQVTINEQTALLVKLIRLAKKLSIPCVFWNTKDHLYHSHYEDFAKQFDYIFCADPNVVESLRKQHIKANILLPAIQPALHNAFREHGDTNEFELGILFDGWVDLIRHSEKLQVLSILKKYGLAIIESKGRLLRGKIDELPEYSSSILGCVTNEIRRVCLKYAKTALTFDVSTFSSTEQQWRALEMAGFRLPVLYRGKLPDGDIRKNIVDEQMTDKALIQRLNHFKNNDLDRKKIGHLAWREVYSNHTFSHRLQSICMELGVFHDWIEFPAISMITPTFRVELLTRCIETFEKQSYPNKDLVLVINSNRQDLPGVGDLVSDKEDIQVIQMPQECFVGGCLNIGNAIAKGEYCLRVDDDDFYGKYCISDISLHLKSIDIDLFGKPTPYFFFEGDECVYERPFRVPDLTIIPPNELEDWTTHVAGNLLGGKREFLLSTGYPDNAFAAADSSFLYSLSEKEFNYCCLDSANMVIYRGLNLQSHTWRLPKHRILDNATALDQETPSDMMY